MTGPTRLAPAHPETPEWIGPYRVLAVLGKGGMGTVYLGERGGTVAAVKAIHDSLAADAGFRARFRQEIEACRAVGGACCARYLDADPDAATPWLATEFVDGPTLQDQVARHGPIKDAQLEVLAAGLAEALEAIHRAGVVHRDLKPSNVVLGPAGPRVIDFGIARAAEGTKVTRTGQVVGTPSAIAPELYEGAAATPAADVFAWGVTVAYAATGRRPFGDDAAHTVMYRVLHDPPDLGGVPEPLRGLCGAALDRDPARRPTPAALLTWLCPAPAGGDVTRIDPAVTRLIETTWASYPPTLLGPTRADRTGIDHALSGLGAEGRAAGPLPPHGTPPPSRFPHRSPAVGGRSPRSAKRHWSRIAAAALAVALVGALATRVIPQDRPATRPRSDDPEQSAPAPIAPRSPTLPEPATTAPTGRSGTATTNPEPTRAEPTAPPPAPATTTPPPLDRTIAGNGTQAYGGDGGPATEAALDTPAAIALDAAGNAYVAESGSWLVRRIDARTGVITTSVGRETWREENGDGGLATDASLYDTQGVALDPAGNLFVSETIGRVIRRVDAATGVITTVGLPNGEGLQYPEGMATDRDGNLYVADTGNYRIVRVNPRSGAFAVVVGATSDSYGTGGDGGPATDASLNEPGDVTVDKDGNLFIADTANNLIRRVDTSTGIITTVAGIIDGPYSGAAGYSGDGGPATAARLSGPEGIAVDPAGNLWIADAGNSVIRRVDGRTGVITTVKTTFDLSEPADVAVAPNGDLIVADSWDHRIVRITPR